MGWRGGRGDLTDQQSLVQMDKLLLLVVLVKLQKCVSVTKPEILNVIFSGFLLIGYSKRKGVKKYYLRPGRQ